MIKNLVAFGCSWTQGAELDDPASQAYPALIAKHFGWTLEDRTVAGSTILQMLNNFNDWIQHNPESVTDAVVLIGLTNENADDRDGRDGDTVFLDTVTALDTAASQHGITMLQFNVLARQHKIKLPTLIDSSSALEMLVIRNKPRKAPLFTENKFPNKKGHIIISEFLIDKINSVIINE